MELTSRDIKPVTKGDKLLSIILDEKVELCPSCGDVLKIEPVMSEDRKATEVAFCDGCGYTEA